VVILRTKVRDKVNKSGIALTTCNTTSTRTRSLPFNTVCYTIFQDRFSILFLLALAAQSMYTPNTLQINKD